MKQNAAIAVRQVQETIQPLLSKQNMPKLKNSSSFSLQKKKKKNNHQK
jgi:hypothetical protein